MSSIPVTLITGFLGAGKTTLLNHILTGNHGKRIAVIENEYGEIGIDHELVIQTDEEIFEMNNGCLCCTVRGDLIRILGTLLKRRQKFDAILIETTGLADPGPVIQTFFMDDEMKAQLRVDAVLTVVDARHVLLHLDSSEECRKQIAFADIVLLNKTDLATPAELDALEKRIHAINATAKIVRTQNSVVDLDQVIGVGAFDLDKALEIDPELVAQEPRFEYGGLYRLEAGDYEYALNDAQGGQTIAFFPVTEVSHHGLHHAEHRAEELFGRGPEPVAAGGVINPEETPSLLAPSGTSFVLRVPAAGAYALFTGHNPGETGARIVRDGQAVEAAEGHGFGSHDPHAHEAHDHGHEHEHNHIHEADISSVGIDLPGNLKLDPFQKWLGELLQKKGADIYRFKGIVSLAGSDKEFVFQGIHMLVDGRPGKPWGTRERRNRLVFIGKHLDRAALELGVRSALA